MLYMDQAIWTVTKMTGLGHCSERRSCWIPDHNDANRFQNYPISQSP